MKNLLRKTNIKRVNLLFLLATILIFSLLQIKAVNAENGNINLSVEGKIIGGKRSESSAWPWMAYIIVTDKEGAQYACGGSLVAPEWVLTAAHCVEDMVSEDILLGQNDLSGSGGEYISADEVVIHPDRDKDAFYADLALLHLERPSSFEPVVVADNFDFQLEKGNSAKAIGWGLTRQGLFSDDQPTNLQEVDLTIKENSSCDSLGFPGNVICLGTFDNKAVCNGDSGGPLLILDSVSGDWKQIGITSFGLKKCSVSYGISVFTQADKFKQFIDATISQDMTEETSEKFLAKCVKKFPEFLGEKDGVAYDCGDSEVCQSTTGGEHRDIRQISVLRDNKEEVLEFLDMTTKQWHTVSFSEIGYCE